MNESNHTLADDWLIERLPDDLTNATTTISASSNGAISFTGSLVVVVQSSPTTTTITPPTSPATVLVVVNVTSNSAYYWSTTSAQDDLDQIDTALLWLPYVIFTIVLLGLIAVSFLRFHCERGNQYRRRQAEISDKLQHGNVQDSLRLLPTSSQEAEMMTSLHLGGGVSLMPGPALQQPNGFGPTRDGIPQHMNLFVQYSQVNPGSRPPNEASENVNEEDTCQIISLDEGKHRKKQPEDEMKSDHKSKRMFFFSGKENRKKAGSTGSGSRRPIVFTFNCNGSMVDVRCEERTNTFRIAGVSRASDENTSGGFEQDKHRSHKRTIKQQLAAHYSKSRPHLHSSRTREETTDDPTHEARLPRQSTLPPPMNNGSTSDPSKRLVKNRSMDVPPPVSIFDPLSLVAGAPLLSPYPPAFIRFSKPSPGAGTSSAPFLFSQAAFTQMQVTSVNFTAASLTTPRSSGMNTSAAYLPLLPEMSKGVSPFDRPDAPLIQQSFSPQMFSQPTHLFPSSQRQHQFPTLLQSPTSEGCHSSQNKEQLLIQMHRQQSLLQQKLLQNKQQSMQSRHKRSFDEEPFLFHPTEGPPFRAPPPPLQKPQHSCPHQPKSDQQVPSQVGHHVINLQQAVRRQHQQSTKVSVHHSVALPRSEQSATGQGSKRPGHSPGQPDKQQRSLSQETPQRCRSFSKTTQSLTTQQQQQQISSKTAAVTTTFPSSLAHQPFFSARRQHNRSAQTIFAANRAPIFGSDKRSRETEIENEALLLWQKQI